MKKLFGWFTANPYIAVGIVVLIGLAAFAIVQMFKYWDSGDQRHENQLQTQGAQGERLKSNEEAFNAVVNSNRPVSEPERRNVCNKYDRNRSANCP